MCKDEGSGATDRPNTSDTHGGTANHSHLQGRATADENGRWGVAVGILNTEDCGDEGNP